MKMFIQKKYLFSNIEDLKNLQPPSRSQERENNLKDVLKFIVDNNKKEEFLKAV